VTQRGQAAESGPTSIVSDDVARILGRLRTIREFFDDHAEAFVTSRS